MGKRTQGHRSSGGHSPRKKYHLQLDASKEDEAKAKRLRRKSIGLTDVPVQKLVESRKK